MSNYKWLLDAGHGGMKDGKYTTAPAKMHIFDDGLTIYEGVINRNIVETLSTLLDSEGIEHTLIHDGERDTPLKERVSRANALYAKDKRCIYLSVHSNAMPDGAHGKGSGFSIYTSPGKTRSDAVAEIFCMAYRDGLKKFRFRPDLSDGDADMEESFYVLKKTKCPAILMENLFFDNRREAEFLLSFEGWSEISIAMADAILEIEESKPI